MSVILTSFDISEALFLPGCTSASRPHSSSSSFSFPASAYKAISRSGVLRRGGRGQGGACGCRSETDSLLSGER